MLTTKDVKQIVDRGMNVEVVNQQISQFRTGFPFLKLSAPASIGNGILSPSLEEKNRFIAAWEQYKESPHRIVKFVPASGAASRMFKDLFAFLDAADDIPQTSAVRTFFEHLPHFAFKEHLCTVCQEKEGKNLRILLDEKKYKTIVRHLLSPDGLSYGQLPKGLLIFHEYGKGESRTPMEEHLVEAALYANVAGEANVHFTVSHAHLPLFESMVIEKQGQYADKYGINYHISFSEQKPSTDTIAVNSDNTPFRTADGQLLFRPGGHGALIENLNDLEADIVFIKNIDNVVPDRLKPEIVEYKKLLAGILVEYQHKLFQYMGILDSSHFMEKDIMEMESFLRDRLFCQFASAPGVSLQERAMFLRKKFNRPLRVCGMVKNIGEPGGGPFMAYNADGTVSPQILESSQIDKNNASYVQMFNEGTHFNPVDLVCATRDYQGHPFNLKEFVDSSTGFISSKSKDGRELKALELPGLWNGAMSDWNTVFVEVPLSTFNPVKTVNDLLRPEHQP